MRTRWILLLVFLGIISLPNSRAWADNGPHGGYSPSSDSCSACHRVHTARGTGLITLDNIVQLCESCHGSSASGADSNVWDGIYVERDSIMETPAEGTTNRGLKAGGFVNSAMNTSLSPVGPTGVISTTSSHTFDGSLVTSWGNGSINPTADPGPTIPLACHTCHNPHGRSGVGSTPTYRILRAIPKNSSGTGWDVPDEVVKEYTIGSDIGLYWTQSYIPIASDLSNWCAQCHARYLAPPNSETTPSGDALFTYRHRSNGVSGPNCINCHVAHGTSASMGPNSGSVPFPDGSAAPTLDSRSALLRLDNRGVCIQCHQLP